MHACLCVSPARREVTRPIRQVEHWWPLVPCNIVNNACSCFSQRAWMTIMHANEKLWGIQAWSRFSIFNMRRRALFTRSVWMYDMPPPIYHAQPKLMEFPITVTGFIWRTTVFKWHEAKSCFNVKMVLNRWDDRIDNLVFTKIVYI